MSDINGIPDEEEMTEEVSGEQEIRPEFKGEYPEEFFTKAENGRQVIWLLNRDDGTAGSYETSEEGFGVTNNGEIVWGFSSGCPCWMGWEGSEIKTEPTYKEFLLKANQPETYLS